MDVGFVGLGAMGAGMVGSLLRAGHRPVVWNRTVARAEALAAQDPRVAVARTPADAARARVVVTMVADDAALEAVVSGPDGILAGLPVAGVHVSMSTIGTDTAERMARRHEEANRAFVSAPVFGRPEVAAAGQLAIVAAGRPDPLALVTPLLEAMSRRVFVVGEEPPRANVVKLAGNFLITAAIEGLAEAAAVVEKAGVGRAQLLEILLGTLFDAPVYRTYGRIVLEERFSPPGFPLRLGLKDNRLLLQAGERLAVPLPLASLVRDRMLAAIARGYGELDWASFGRISAEDARTAERPLEPRG